MPTSRAMLLKNPISNTKKFFQKTLQNFKSFFSAGYQKLPKTPPHHPFTYSVAAGSVIDMNIHPSYRDLDKFYTDFKDQWDSEKDKAVKIRSRKKTMLSSPTRQPDEEVCGNGSSLINFNSKTSPLHGQNNKQIESRSEENQNQSKSTSVTHQRRKQEDSLYSNSKGKREQRNCMVAQKLKELETFDMGNVDYVLDIEEVLHYYSRLTCPAYLEIVDKFFMDMYSEFFALPQLATPSTANSRLRLRSVRSCY
ncbi:ATP-dependent RNA helicase DDX11-like protein [Quillaja saponaria]|uniref:ATP-dependent RNA helicase DDX11-like protein n=1 Tax=Quillaja saponaria TaxID=32244 RepID=A0AAD7Q2Y0_QUISA|nr:ATP-dependent RNA helicase DDX11-like protein [Quillaja saponaria]